MTRAIVWFRRDLRLHDHPALSAAIAEADEVIPLFVVDDALVSGRWPAPNRIWFMRQSLVSLAASIRERGGRLRFARGRPAGGPGSAHGSARRGWSDAGAPAMRGDRASTR